MGAHRVPPSKEEESPPPGEKLEKESEHHMSKTTLARRIRRIGILPTTYKTIVEQRLSKDEDGKKVSISAEIKKPVRNHMNLSLESLKLMREALIAEARAARRGRKGQK